MTKNKEKHNSEAGAGAGASLESQWLELLTPMQGARVQFLGRGLRSCCCGGWSLCSRLEKPNTLIRSCTGRGQGGNKKKRQL